MLTAKLGPASIECLLEHGECLGKTAGGAVRIAKVAHGAKGVGVVGTEPGLRALQGLLLQQQCFAVPADCAVQCRQVTHRDQGIGVVGTDLGRAAA